MLNDFFKDTPLKKGIELREYQMIAAKQVLEKGNSLVIMPTALGKTFVAILVIAKLLEKNPLAKVLFLTPTKPLAVQQAKRIRELLVVDEKKVVVLTGEVPPQNRGVQWSELQFVCATPQTVQSDLITRKVDLSDFSLIVFDEVHRATGDYSYSFLAQQVKNNSKSLLLGLTASPSSEREKIDEIISNLGIKHVVIRTDKDEDVIDFVKKTRLDWVFVELPKEFKLIRDDFESILHDVLIELKKTGFLEKVDTKNFNKRDLLSLRLKILPLIGKDVRAYSAMSLQAQAMNLTHAIDLLESQGVYSLKKFLEEMKTREKKTKAVKNLLSDARMKNAFITSTKLIELGVDHPKYQKLRELIHQQVSQKKNVIVFAHYRNTIDKIVEELNSLAGVQAEKLVGKANEGMTQKRQAQVISDFREQKFNVLVSSSVGEEGLDIPSVDSVIFFEAVPSEIRAIQRRGRAGRVKAGSIIVLLAEDTKDEAFFWIARRKEKKMNELIKGLQKDLSDESVFVKQKKLFE